MAEKKLRRFIPMYGGKRSIAGRYPEPRCGRIIEPFAGGAGYSLEYSSRLVHLSDLDERVCGVWDFLIHASEADVLRIPSEVQHVDDLPAQRYGQEIKWLVGWWLSPGAAAGPSTKAYGWGGDGPKGHKGRSDVWGEKCKQRIASQLHRIRHWTIQQDSYEVLDPTIKATWFVDAPYQEMGKHYVHGSTAIDYALLATWCQSLQGQVIVCENKGADWLPFEPLCEMVGGQRHRTIEMMWTQ